MLSVADLKRQWHEITTHPVYSQLPGKVETNEQGQIIVTPNHNFGHTRYQKQIAWLLDKNEGGQAFIEPSIATKNGIRNPDVIWLSNSQVTIASNEGALSVCPQICVEVWSPGNRNHERIEKPRVYFEAGAQEVWTCTNGEMEFLNRAGMLDKSEIFPHFPAIINI